MLRDFDFSNVQYPQHSEFARAALDHELQQCRTDAEQVQLLKSLLLQSENKARNQLLKYPQQATFNTECVFIRERLFEKLREWFAISFCRSFGGRFFGSRSCTGRLRLLDWNFLFLVLFHSFLHLSCFRKVFRCRKFFRSDFHNICLNKVESYFSRTTST